MYYLLSMISCCKTILAKKVDVYNSATGFKQSHTRIMFQQERIQTALMASVAVSNCTVPNPLDLLSESRLISARITFPAKHHIRLK